MTELRWWQRGAIYQIYPRSFSDSNGDGVGDLRGIVSRLDYLRRLGVAAIWLSPFYPSPMADFGYDVADYTDVDPLFGTLDDFDRLIEEAHGRGIRVMIDWVPNHSSDQHPWFVASRSARDNPKRDWYVWRDPAPDGGPPNHWVSAFSTRKEPAWTFDDATGQYYLHSFLAQQPDLNWDNPEVEAAMHDVLRFWLRRGVDGFRIDVIQKLAKDPELRDNEPGLRHDEDWPPIHERLRRIRAVIDEFDDRVIAGEVYILDLSRLVTYVSSGDELDLAHNFVFLHQPWDAQAFRATVEEWTSLAGPVAWPAWFLANHDHPRVATRFGSSRVRVAAMLVATLRGTPFIYQGEELGLPDAKIPPDRIVDVDGRDPERAPIPWEPGPGGGFTTGEPWLPLVADADELAVSVQDADPDSTLNFARELLAVRPLLTGPQRSVDAAAGLYCFTRDAHLVALNFTSERVALGLRGEATIVLSTHPSRARGSVELDALVLEPDEGLIMNFPNGTSAD